MDSKKAEVLRKKYWEGKLSNDEEEELKLSFLNDSYEDDPEQAYFNYLNKKRARNFLDGGFDQEILNQIDVHENSKKPKRIAIKYWYAAASLALIISISIIFNQRFIHVDKVEKVVKVDTYEDPKKAFEETKRALLMVSSRLNQSGEYATEFSKFDESQNKLNQN